MTDEPLAFEPFAIDIPEAALDDLKRRLGATRWPDQLPGQEWVYGAEKSELQELVAHWANGYNWRTAENEINRWPQFLTTIDGEQIHLVHVRSADADAIPLLLTHGWPGSIVEFVHLIETLTAPTDGATPFHLVIPSLPGFGFSGPTVTTGVHPQRIAGMWKQLMAGLGYDRYVAQGGDWGSIITSFLARADPEHCIGVHLNMLAIAPSSELIADATDEERLMLERNVAFRTHETGYQAIQGSKPQTLSYALADSPTGLCAWIYEKFHTWTDNNGQVFDTIDRDRFLTNVMLYWLTNTAGSAARIYYEFQHAGQRLSSSDRGAVPMAGAMFEKEIYRASRRWAEEYFKVVHWSTFDEGGHFAALEQPEALVDDLRSFVALLV